MDQLPRQVRASFLPLEGEMGAQIEAFDWSGTPLGPIESWSYSFRASLSFLLRSALPSLILYGEQGTLLYNDAYAKVIGSRHPSLLGKPFAEGWPEYAEMGRYIIGRFMAGKVRSFHDLELQFSNNGQPTAKWVSFDCSPLFDDQGNACAGVILLQDSTQRVLAEQALKAQQLRLEAIFEQAPGLMAILGGPEHHIERINPAVERFFSQPLAGKKVSEALPELHAQGACRVLDQVYQSAQAFVADELTLTIKGQPRQLHVVLQPLKDHLGQVNGIFIEGYDVTQRVQAQAKMRQSDQRLRALTAASTVLRWQADKRLEYVRQQDVNGELDQQTQVLKTWLAATFLPEDQLRIQHFFEQAWPRAEMFDVECRLQEDSLWPSWVLLRGVPLFDDAGELQEWFLAAIDISGRKQAEEGQRRNQRRLAFFDRLNREVGQLDTVFEVIHAAVRLLGQSLDVTGCVYADVKPDENGYEMYASWRAAGLVGKFSLDDFGPDLSRQLRSGQIIQIADAEKIAEPALGMLKRLSATALLAVPFIHEGRLVAYVALKDACLRFWQSDEVALVKELLERLWPHVERIKTAELVRQNEQRFVLELEQKVQERTAELAESEAKLRAITEASYQYQGLLDAEGRCMFFNATALSAIESELSPLVGQFFWLTPWFNHTPGASEKVRKACLTAQQGKTTSLTLNLQLPIGLRILEVSLRPAFDEEGRVFAIVPESIDKTAWLKAEQGKQQAQKLEALGRLSGGIAHDFNNLLTAVLGSLELLRRRLPDEPKWIRLLDNAMAAAQRGATLTGRMLSFARKQELHAQGFDLRELITGMKELVSSSLGPEVILNTRFSEQPCVVKVDAHQLETALLNLLVNARDAIEGKGIITLSVSRHELTAAEQGLDPGRYVCLRVMDNGMGMDEQTLKRASEPFFTTKGVGKGTGLGLSMVHGLALQLGGALIIKSELGLGTSAQIWLPEYEGPLSPLSVTSNPEPLPQPSKRSLLILVVDDDELVLVNTVDMLLEHGHQVLSASSSKDALVILKQMPFDLMITDYAMPRSSGLELIEQARTLYPNLVMLLVSGYAELPDGKATNIARLAKPFTQCELLKAVDELFPQ